MSFPSNYEDYVAECLRRASEAVDESESQLYLGIAEATKNVSLAQQDVINDPDARRF